MYHRFDGIPYGYYRCAGLLVSTAVSNRQSESLFTQISTGKTGLGQIQTGNGATVVYTFIVYRTGQNAGLAFFIQKHLDVFAIGDRAKGIQHRNRCRAQTHIITGILYGQNDQVCPQIRTSKTIGASFQAFDSAAIVAAVQVEGVNIEDRHAIGIQVNGHIAAIGYRANVVDHGYGKVAAIEIPTGVFQVIGIGIFTQVSTSELGFAQSRVADFTTFF